MHGVFVIAAVFCMQVLDKHKSDSLTNLMEKLDECLADGIVILTVITRAKIILRYTALQHVMRILQGF